MFNVPYMPKDASMLFNNICCPMPNSKVGIPSAKSVRQSLNLLQLPSPPPTQTDSRRLTSEGGEGWKRKTGNRR